MGFAIHCVLLGGTTAMQGCLNNSKLFRKCIWQVLAFEVKLSMSARAGTRSPKFEN